jgi:tripartite-type tricarboxylate transporter receptor subunit TctC
VLPTSCTGLLALLATLATPAFAQQDGFPTHPIRVVVPFPPGGSNDIIARAIALRMTESLGKPVIVENKAGAGGVIGSEYVARATPDGHTLLFSSSTFSVTAATRKLPYDALGDFTGVASIGRGPMMIVTHPSIPANNIGELLALVRAKPGQFDYGTPGNGSINHLGMELFAYATKIQVVHVPYKGISPAVNDTVSGQLQIGMASLPSAYQFVKAGKLRALAVTGDKRIPGAPEIPTLAESGITDAKVELRWGVLAPAKTPRAIVQRLHGEIRRAVDTKEIREMLEREGAEITPISPEEFQRDIGREITMWKTFAETAKIRVD